MSIGLASKPIFGCARQSSNKFGFALACAKIGLTTNKNKTMEEKQRAYHDGDTIYILMGADSVRGVLEDWVEQNRQCDLVVHRSRKHKGKYVIETTDVIWSSRIIQWHKCDQVIYRPLIKKGGR